jgi:zinc transport system substrate-binding protein
LDESRSGRPLVVVSVEPHRYFVEQLSGGAVEVIALLPPGASPTHFEPGMQALRALERASLLVRVGHPHFPFERAWLNRLLSDRSDLRIVDAHTEAAHDDGQDPHAWLSPAAASTLVDRLTPEIARLLGDDVGVRARARALHSEIEALDLELRGTLAPVRGGRFLVLHPAWGHFARHYGLEQLAIEHEGKAPGPRELSELVLDAQRAGLRSVIVMPQIDPGQAHSVARAIAGRVVELDPLAADWPGSMRRTARLLASEAVVP